MKIDQVLGIISTVKVKDGRENDYYRALIELIENHSTLEPDCIDIIVHRDVDDPTRIMLYERWRIASDRFVREQMTKSFIAEFNDGTREMVVADEDITYWHATDLVAKGERIALAGHTPKAL